MVSLLVQQMYPLGWYSLNAASLLHHVDVFEANILNVFRLCQSQLLNEWPTATESDIASREGKNKRPSINIRNFGVSNASLTMSLFFGKNPGKGTFVNTDEFLPQRKGWKLREMDSIQMVSLDRMAMDLGWLEEKSNNRQQPKSKIAILKIDVEGSEPSVVAGAKRLLGSGLVENLVMEISGRHDSSETIEMVRSIVYAGFVLHRIGSYAGPDKVPTQLLKLSNDELPRALVEKFAAKAGSHANLWWKHGSVVS